VKRKKKSHGAPPYQDVELNIMPFIDVFSLLNTFLLYSAVFLTIGIIEVQIPFMSSAEPPPDQKTRFVNINVNIQKDLVELTKVYSAPPSEEEKDSYPLTPVGLADLHRKLVEYRRRFQDIDKATVYSDDEVTFKQLTAVLDEVKFRRDADRSAPVKDPGPAEGKYASQLLYPKVVMGSVLLN